MIEPASYAGAAMRAAEATVQGGMNPFVVPLLILGLLIAAASLWIARGEP